MKVSAVKYPSIHSKLSGMYSKKIKKNDLSELLKQNNTKQVVALLKSFNEDFKDLEDNPIRIKIKILLDNILIRDIKKIYRLLNKNDKKIFLEFVSIYKIKCIKSVFRKIFSNSIINEQTNEIEVWTDNLFYDLKELQNVNTFEQFQEVLNKTEYRIIFNQYDSDINQINIFEIENKLDKMYFEKFMKFAKKHNNGLEDMIGKQIDLNNIIWIYRVKEHYNFSKEDVKNILINVNYKLKKNEIEKLVQADNRKEIDDILNKSYYAKYINFQDTEKIEENIDKYLYTLYQKYFRGNIFDSSSIYAYISIIEEENNDILNVVEGIRYNLDKDEIKKKLVR